MSTGCVPEDVTAVVMAIAGVGVVVVLASGPASPPQPADTAMTRLSNAKAERPARPTVLPSGKSGNPIGTAVVAQDFANPFTLLLGGGALRPPGEVTPTLWHPPHEPKIRTLLGGASNPKVGKKKPITWENVAY